MKITKTTASWDATVNYLQSRPDKKYDAISPSSLHGCLRAHYWKLKGIKSTTPPSTAALANFEVGRYWEQFLADAYKSQGMLVKHFQDESSDKLYDPVTTLGGTPDLLVKLNGELVIVDAKTVNSGWFRYNKTKTSEQWVASNAQYVMQQVAYIYLCQLKGYDVNKAILSFASKDDGYIGLEFMMEVTKKDIDEVVARALRLKGYLDRNELPPCECTDWKVGYCNYGNPQTRQPNSKKKMVNTECCGPSYVLTDTK